MKKNLIDYAYDVAKEEFKDQPFTFNQLWKPTYKAAKIKSTVAKEYIGDFYTDLLQDIRFVLLGKQTWKLKEYVKFNEYEKMSKAMFGYEEYHEAEYEEFLNENEIKAIKNKNKVEPTVDLLDELGDLEDAKNTEAKEINALLDKEINGE